jgi:hypothetical protein
MSDVVLLDGDQVIFMPAFGEAVVVVQPGQLRGGGPATYQNKKICVAGDESQVSVPGCAYITPTFSIPGTGTLKILNLAANQKAQKSQTGGKKMLLKGGQFMAKFEVQSPAKMPPPGPGAPIPDPKPFYQGQGSFQSTNLFFKGS